MHIGQAAVDAVVADGQPSVVDAQLMQDRRVDVVDLRGMVAVQRFVAPLVRLAVGDSAFDATTAQPVRKNVRIVIATFAGLSAGHAAEFGGPQDQVSSSRPRCLRSLINAAVPIAMPRASGPWSRAMSSWLSQLRRGKPLSLPDQICTNRTPRSSSRRAVRHLRPKYSTSSGALISDG